MARPILETLGQLRRGLLLSDLSERMADLVKQVKATGRGGKLTLTLTVKPAGKGVVRNVVVEDEVALKLPAPDKEATIFFPTEDGSLSRSDPNQYPLPLAAVPAAAAAAPAVVNVPPGPGGPAVSVEVSTGEVVRLPSA